MSKITNPVVLIYKRENSDTYAVAITNGSGDYHDAVLMATMEPDMAGDDVDTEQNRLLHGGGDSALTPAVDRPFKYWGVNSAS